MPEMPDKINGSFPHTEQEHIQRLEQSALLTLVDIAVDQGVDEKNTETFTYFMGLNFPTFKTELLNISAQTIWEQLDVYEYKEAEQVGNSLKLPFGRKKFMVGTITDSLTRSYQIKEGDFCGRNGFSEEVNDVQEELYVQHVFRLFPNISLALMVREFCELIRQKQAFRQSELLALVPLTKDHILRRSLRIRFDNSL